jgi:hypothetical protein
MPHLLSFLIQEIKYKKYAKKIGITNWRFAPFFMPLTVPFWTITVPFGTITVPKRTKMALIICKTVRYKTC